MQHCINIFGFEENICKVSKYMIDTCSLFFNHTNDTNNEHFFYLVIIRDKRNAFEDFNDDLCETNRIVILL